MSLYPDLTAPLLEQLTATERMLIRAIQIKQRSSPPSSSPHTQAWWQCIGEVSLPANRDPKLKRDRDWKVIKRFTFRLAHLTDMGRMVEHLRRSDLLGSIRVDIQDRSSGPDPMWRDNRPDRTLWITGHPGLSDVNYRTAEQVAARKGTKYHDVRMMCRDSDVSCYQGARRFGRTWLIPLQR